MFEVREIPITKGYVTFVDECDYKQLMQWKWTASINKHTVYARRNSRKEKPGKCTSIFMHRQILGALPSQYIDHINGNGLDNRRCNIRICNQSLNLANQRPQSRQMYSKFKGVSYCRRKGDIKKWYAYIKIKGERHFLGYYKKEEDAARAYNNAALRYFDEFARLNDI